MDLQVSDSIWEPITLNEQEVAHLKMGPLKLWLVPYSFEWQIFRDYEGDSLKENWSREIPFTGALPDKFTDKLKRFGLHDRPSTLHLRPLLADRPIVIRPEIPFYLPKKEDVHLFISTPLWIKIQLSESETTLEELPVFRPSDTWFGPSTIEGELCYASKTLARLRLQDLPIRFHRAITVIHLRNLASDALFLERLKVPVPQLSLFRSEEGLFHTESITIEREKTGEEAHIKLGKTPAKIAGKAHKVCGPRVPLDKNFMSKAFATFFN